jgi:hypothetical protein
MSDEATPEAQRQDSPERLQAALEAPCMVRLRTDKGRITACIPELGVIARAGSVEAAHAEALRQREARLREFAEAGLLDELPRPTAVDAGPPRLLPQLKVFLVKAAVAAVLFLGAVDIISGGLRDIGYVLEKKLDGVAAWTPETVEKHRAQAARLAQKLGPVVRELLKPADAQPAPADNAAADNATARP